MYQDLLVAFFVVSFELLIFGIFIERFVLDGMLKKYH